MSELNTLQTIEMDILKQTLKVIEMHDLSYFMLGGTLLGAVRHKGFIPWDDDIDIGLPRPDYEKFLKYAHEELEAPYRLHFIKENNSDNYYYYARIENTNIKLLRTVSMEPYEVYSWIDVFPLDGVPNDSKEQREWLSVCGKIHHKFKMSQFSYFALPSNRATGSKMHRKLRDIFYKFKLEKLISTGKTWEALDRELRKYDYNDCDSLINFCGAWGVKEMFPKSVYGNGKLYQFEDLMLMGPEDYDYVLSQMYGDYMTPPPVDKRNRHYVQIIKD